MPVTGWADARPLPTQESLPLSLAVGALSASSYPPHLPLTQPRCGQADLPKVACPGPTLTSFCTFVPAVPPAWNAGI